MKTNFLMALLGLVTVGCALALVAWLKYDPQLNYDLAQDFGQIGGAAAYNFGLLVLSAFLMLSGFSLANSWVDDVLRDKTRLLERWQRAS
jgi:hypothetical protein